MIRKRRQRCAQGKRSRFVVRDKEVSSAEIERYVQRKRARKASFDETPAEALTPDHIQCFSVPPSPSLNNDRKELHTLSQENDVQLDRTIISTQPSNRKHCGSTSTDSLSSLVFQRNRRGFRARARTPSLPAVISLPDALRYPQKLFKIIPIYVQRMIGNSHWFLDNKGWLMAQSNNESGAAPNPFDLYAFCSQAIDSFQISLLVRGRFLLSQAFSFIPTLLLAQQPRLLERMLDTLLLLTEKGFVGICAMLQDHIVHLAKIILPKGDILQQIIILLFLDDPEHQELIFRSWRCLADAWGHTLGGCSVNTVRCELAFLRRKFRNTSPNREEQALRTMVVAYVQKNHELNETTLHIMEGLVNCLLAQQKNAEAEKLVEDILSQPQNTGSLSAGRQAALLEEIAQAQFWQDKNDLAENNLRQAISMYAEAFGGTDPAVIRCCGILEGWVRNWGRSEEADVLGKTIDKMIGPDDTVPIQRL
jgi:hypothetical protein